MSAFIHSTLVDPYPYVLKKREMGVGVWGVKCRMGEFLLEERLRGTSPL